MFNVLFDNHHYWNFIHVTKNRKERCLCLRNKREAEIVDVAPSCPAELLPDWEGVCWSLGTLIHHLIVILPSFYSLCCLFSLSSLQGGNILVMCLGWHDKAIVRCGTLEGACVGIPHIHNNQNQNLCWADRRGTKAGMGRKIKPGMLRSAALRQNGGIVEELPC